MLFKTKNKILFVSRNITEPSIPAHTGCSTKLGMYNNPFYNYTALYRRVRVPKCMANTALLWLASLGESWYYWCHLRFLLEHSFL